jgi:hypothetical protein
VSVKVESNKGIFEAQAGRVTDRAVMNKAAYGNAYNNLYLLLVLMGVGGTTLGYIMVNRAKDEYSRSKKEFDDNMSDIRASKIEFKADIRASKIELKATMNEASVEFKKRMEEAKSHEENLIKIANDAEDRNKKIYEDAEKILGNINPIDKETDLEKETIEQVANDNNAPAQDRIRALALRAVEKSNWKEALPLWQSLEAIFPNDSQVLFYLGYVFSFLADTPDYDTLENLKKARYYYEKTALISKDDPLVFSNWGNALLETGRLSTKAEANQLFAEGIEKCTESVRLNPNFALPFNNWGCLIMAMAEHKEAAEVLPFYTLAKEKFSEAIRLDPNFVLALSNLGNTLYSSAKRIKGAESDHLLAEAIVKFTEASRLDLNDLPTLKNWGITLLAMGARKSGPEADLLFDEAEKKFLLADEISPDSDHYNFSCLYALTNEKDKCREHFEKSISGKDFPGAEHVDDDDDFDNVREEEWFKALLDMAREKEAAAE